MSTGMAPSGAALTSNVSPMYANLLGVQEFNPLEDSRWESFVRRHPRSSLFHSTSWLKAIQKTYAYEPIVLTTSRADEELRSAVLFCRIRSWATGRRLVSVPFSDHCEPLVDDDEDLLAIKRRLEYEVFHSKADYIELRPKEADIRECGALRRSTFSYSLHRLDLRSDLDTVFRRFHTSTRRNVRRAARVDLTYENGHSPSHLAAFWRLYVDTRRRFLVPPQPRAWFHNLIDSLGEAVSIQVAFHNRMPIAAILTLRHGDTMFYKYGAWDIRFKGMGAMHSLVWRAIQDAKSGGAQAFDLGRTDHANEGLLTFKHRFGAVSSILTYSRFAPIDSKAHYGHGSAWKQRAAARIIGSLPDSLFRILGSVAYKHIG